MPVCRKLRAVKSSYFGINAGKMIYSRTLAKRKSYCGPISVRASDARAQAASASFRKSPSACV